MPKKLELAGERFGNLVVISESKIKSKGRSRWLCHCYCGNETVVVGSKLRNGHTKSCGCLKYKRYDLSGKRFGKLTATISTEKDTRNKSRWKCLCDCGNETTVRIDCLSSGNTKSCGCLQKEAARKIAGNIMLGKFGKDHHVYKHGLTNSRIYKAQAASKRRLIMEDQTPQNSNIDKILYMHKICSKINNKTDKKYEVDHIMPLSKGGLHHENNLQILSKSLNAEKSSKWPLNKREMDRYAGITLAAIEQKENYIDLLK